MTAELETTIVVADDDADVAETTAMRLRDEGWEIVVASDGLQALGAIRVHQPRLAILDVMMPGENGYRVAHLVRQDEAKGVYERPIRIVLLTARDLSGDPERERMFQDFSGADRTIYKPCDLEELVATVRGLLEG